MGMCLVLLQLCMPGFVDTLGDLPVPNRNGGVGSEGEWREEPGREKEGKLRLGYK